MASTSSRYRKFSVSCTCMVSNVQEVDIHDLVKNWLRELVGSGWLRIKTITSMMTIELN